MSKVLFKKMGIIMLLLIIIIIYQFLDIGQLLSFESLKANQSEFDHYYQNNPIFFSGIFLVVYILITAFSIPGATILTLAGGAIFGLLYGTLLVSFASSIGATIAFLSSRYLFKDFVQIKFSESIQSINDGVKKDGAFYLFTLRLVPLVPFFLVNLIMGVTTMSPITFYFVSQIGMLVGTVVYINAGTQLAQLNSLQGILSSKLLFSFALLGLFPLISKKVIDLIRLNKNLRKFKKPNHFDYNIIVIGAGSAGLVSAYIASAVKAKVALIEKNKMGGDCLNTGCVPSKALIKSAKVVNYIKRAADFGIESPNLHFKFSEIMARVQSVIMKIEPHDSEKRYSNLGVDCIKGTAIIKSPFEVEVNGKTLTTKNIVIATGASPHVPNIPGLNEVPYLTSDNIWSLRELPKRLIVLGGGPIGCELAQSFSRFGSQVILIEMAPRIMIREDQDVSQVVTEKLKADGVKVLTSHIALRIEIEGIAKYIICETGGQEVKISFDQTLIALGRKANVTGFGLENLNVEVSQRGTIVADEYLRTTNYPNIFVCGDVTGPYQFTHTAAHQAWYVAVNALFSPFKTFKVDYRVIPWCTFTDPEVARVGLNEQDAFTQKIPYEVTRYGIDDLDRAIAESEDHGFVKVLTVPGSDRILGVTIVGAHAGELIAEFVTAMKYGLGLNKILGTIHIYPTFSEANKYTAGVWKMRNAPQKLLKWVQKYHQWRRA